MKTKVCKKCKNEFPLDYYYKSTNYADGHISMCKNCHHLKYDGRPYQGTRTEYGKIKLQAKEFEDGTKLCIKCNTIKPIEEFPNKFKGTKKKASCKECTGDNLIKRKYGLNKEDYISKCEIQNYKCKICGDEIRSLRGLLVDHDHLTGKIRDLLCNSCNSGLGMFKDKSELLILAAEYLKKHQTKREYNIFELEDL